MTSPAPDPFSPAWWSETAQLAPNGRLTKDGIESLTGAKLDLGDGAWYMNMAEKVPSLQAAEVAGAIAFTSDPAAPDGGYFVSNVGFVAPGTTAAWEPNLSSTWPTEPPPPAPAAPVIDPNAHRPPRGVPKTAPSVNAAVPVAQTIEAADVAHLRAMAGNSALSTEDQEFVAELADRLDSHLQVVQAGTTTTVAPPAGVPEGVIVVDGKAINPATGLPYSVKPAGGTYVPVEAGAP